MEQDGDSVRSKSRGNSRQASARNNRSPGAPGSVMADDDVLKLPALPTPEVDYRSLPAEMIEELMSRLTTHIYNRVKG